MKIHTRALRAKDYNEIEYLLRHDAPNEWNYITDQTISDQFEQLRCGDAVASIAENQQIVGFSIMLLRNACLSSLEKYADLADIAYIQDVAVNLGHSGRGLGSQLLLESIDAARQQHIAAVYIARHEENLASAGMMRKAGFVEVETFYDPDRRFSGSRKTTVMKINP